MRPRHRLKVGVATARRLHVSDAFARPSLAKLASASVMMPTTLPNPRSHAPVSPFFRTAGALNGLDTVELCVRTLDGDWLGRDPPFVSALPRAETAAREIARPAKCVFPSLISLLALCRGGGLIFAACSANSRTARLTVAVLTYMS